MFIGSFLRGNKALSAIDKTNHYPGSNAAAIATLSAVALFRHVIHKIVWSYNGDPTGGRITITDGGVTVFDINITKGGPGSLHMSTPFAVNSAVVVTLAAGGSGVTGKLNVEHSIETN